jgi:SAM-dependent methyltransferase
LSREFYDRTALWWGTSRVDARDRLRAANIDRLGGGDVLDLGTGYGGSAAAAADLGHDVLAVDLSPVRVAIARQHCSHPRPGRLVVLVADLDTFAPERRFDIVTYWSGFGVGPPAGHRRLLARIRDWLADGGVALIDVFDPGWWRRRSGQVRQEQGRGQQITYDEGTGRLVDERWVLANPAERVREEIRCYSVPEFAALAFRAGLAVHDARPSLGSPDPPSHLVMMGRR